jgi:hypothetical protein
MTQLAASSATPPTTTHLVGMREMRDESRV